MHGEGRQLRFWGTPDEPAMWKELQAGGVDLIGTDDLDALRTFLMKAADEQ
jgi:alkaline phosphatase